ncbi:hypothetical protein Hdeb2414_s0011g00364471 [Helianthus debilis subsp. tardiflorus]
MIIIGWLRGFPSWEKVLPPFWGVSKTSLGRRLSSFSIFSRSSSCLRNSSLCFDTNSGVILVFFADRGSESVMFSNSTVTSSTDTCFSAVWVSFTVFSLVGGGVVILQDRFQ